MGVAALQSYDTPNFLRCFWVVGKTAFFLVKRDYYFKLDFFSGFFFPFFHFIFVGIIGFLGPPRGRSVVGSSFNSFLGNLSLKFDFFTCKKRVVPFNSQFDTIEK